MNDAFIALNEIGKSHIVMLLLQEDEEDATPKRGRAASQARAESDYSPSASPVRRAKVPAQRPRQPQDGRPPAPKGQKEGGPCAVCFATSKQACLLLSPCLPHSYAWLGKLQCFLTFASRWVHMSVQHPASLTHRVQCTAQLRTI